MLPRKVSMYWNKTPIFIRKVNQDRIGEKIAQIVIFIWYPFTHLYSYHSAVGHLPRVMNGVFGLIALSVVFILGILFLFKSIRGLKKLPACLSLIFAMFIVLALGWAFAHCKFAGGVIGSPQLFEYYARIILDYALLFLLGFYFNLQQEQSSNTYMLVFAIIVFNAIVFTNWDRFVIDLRNVIDPQYSGIYLGLSTTALFTGLITWASLSKPSQRLIVLCAMVPLLFITGSRADFGAFLLVLPVAMWLTLRPHKQMFVYATGFTLLLLVVMVIGPEKLMNSRHAQFLNPGQMTSLMARIELLSWGMERIAASLIFGDYGGTLAIRGSIGSYIHNLLSVWQAFGLFPFLLYTSLLLTSIYTSFQILARYGRKLNRQEQFMVVLTLVTAVEIFAAKSLGWEHVALSWGLITGWLQRRRKATVQIAERKDGYLRR